MISKLDLNQFEKDEFAKKVSEDVIQLLKKIDEDFKGKKCPSKMEKLKSSINSK